ncbi:MAG TPA: hypothetical protein VLS48_09305 [Anaerolineales bacterium]|nr:hypothetical protein [Anaerolineales bacterium]
MTTPAKPAYSLQPGEKVTPVMVYTQNLLIWGDVITKQAIRVSVWLRTPMAPQYLTIHNAQVLPLPSSRGARQQSFSELHVPLPLVLAFHIMPPARDPVDYDPNEPHRVMTPTTTLVGYFRFDGLVRMSSMTNLQRYLDVMKESYSTMYDVEITQTGAPDMGVIRTPFVLLKRDLVLYSPGSER